MTTTDWRVWRDDEPRPAALNMALDEALLSHATETASLWLRIYRWERPAVSFGYFDRLEAVRANFPERELVRRWTGGGAVDHQQDVTFALAVPRSHEIGRMSPLDSYREIHERLVAILRQLGLEAWLACGGDVSPRAEGIAPCFVAPVCADVMIGPEKVAGGAQRRTRLGLLHQGSLQGSVLTASRCGDLRNELASLGLAGQPADRASFEAEAKALAERRYATPEWLGRW